MPPLLQSYALARTATRPRRSPLESSLIAFIGHASEGVLPQESRPTYLLTMADPTTHPACEWWWSRCTEATAALLPVQDCASAASKRCRSSSACLRAGTSAALTRSRSSSFSCNRCASVAMSCLRCACRCLASSRFGSLWDNLQPSAGARPIGTSQIGHSGMAKCWRPVPIGRRIAHSVPSTSR